VIPLPGIGADRFGAESLTSRSSTRNLTASVAARRVLSGIVVILVCGGIGALRPVRAHQHQDRGDPRARFPILR